MINKKQKMQRIKFLVLYILCIFCGFLIKFNISYGQVFIVKKGYNIVDYGAIADGKSLNTLFIQAAIDAAGKEGGGKVIFPKRIFLSGSIEMKSDVDIYLEEGSVLLGSTNPDDYKPMETEGGGRFSKK